MGSAYYPATTTATTATDLPFPTSHSATSDAGSNPRKRPASVAFPSSDSPCKTSRPTEPIFPHPPQAGLLVRWSAVVDTVRNLIMDTAAHLLSSTSSPVEISNHHLAPATLTSDSSSASDASNAGSVSSQSQSPRFDPPPLRQINGINLSRVRKRPRNPPNGHRRRIRHIYYEQHKEDLKQKKKQELYILERLKGYSSDFSTFESLLEYRQRVEEANQMTGQIICNSAITKRKKTSVTDLEGKRMADAIKRARDSLSGPGPGKPFIPTLEQLRIADKVKDLAISQRIRFTLPLDLPDEVREEVQAILKNPRFVSKIGREQVSYKDILRLRPGQWLNDELINFYGQLIVERSINQEAQKENICMGNKDRKGRSQSTPLRIHYFNTFFWPKLQQGYAKSNLRKWTKKLDLFSKDLVLIPINHNQMHWSAAVLNIQEKRIESYDSLDAENANKGNLFALLRHYLQEEHRDKKGFDIDISCWKNYGRPDTPQQENGFDCGVFTLNFLETVARGGDFSFKQSNMPYLRQRMIWEIGKAKLETQL